MTFSLLRRKGAPGALVAAMLLLSPGLARASTPTDNERAKVIIARHLLTAIGTPALEASVRDRSIRQDAYWQRVFMQASAPEIYSAVSSELQRAMRDVPLVNGRAAEPAVFARAVLRGLGPLPLRPLDEAPARERDAVLAFARNELAAFSRDAAEHPGDAGLSAAAASARARRVFHSAVIADALFQMGQTLGSDDDSRVALVDTKDRLNEYLHPFGLHLVIDGASLEAGRVNLASYVILRQHAFNILGTPFAVYEVRPSVKAQSTAALGHAEVESGYMFIFTNHVDEEVTVGLAFVGGTPVNRLWRRSDGQPLLGDLSPLTVERIEKAVRERLREANASDPQRYRNLLIHTIGRHEGFHTYFQTAVAAAVRRGKLSRDGAGAQQENGAYLYELEVDDPGFLRMDLLMLLFVATSGDGVFADNTAGAQAAFNDLQAYVSGVRFWDAARNAPIDDGIAALFEMDPTQIQKAASQARWDDEMALRN